MRGVEQLVTLAGFGPRVRRGCFAEENLIEGGSYLMGAGVRADPAYASSKAWRRYALKMRIAPHQQKDGAGGQIWIDAVAQRHRYPHGWSHDQVRDALVIRGDQVRASARASSTAARMSCTFASVAQAAQYH